jgi:hypothetical protein
MLHAGETGGDVFILIRGEISMLDSDGTFLFKVPEGTIFGEATVLRHLQVRKTSILYEHGMGLVGTSFGCTATCSQVTRCGTWYHNSSLCACLVQHPTKQPQAARTGMIASAKGSCYCCCCCYRRASRAPSASTTCSARRPATCCASHRRT